MDELFETILENRHFSLDESLLLAILLLAPRENPLAARAKTETISSGLQNLHYFHVWRCSALDR